MNQQAYWIIWEATWASMLRYLIFYALGSQTTTTSDNDTSWFSQSPYKIVQKPIQMHAFALALFASLVAPFGGFFASVNNTNILKTIKHM